MSIGCMRFSLARVVEPVLEALLEPGVRALADLGRRVVRLGGGRNTPLSNAVNP
jgi:hypothetical protein